MRTKPMQSAFAHSLRISTGLMALSLLTGCQLTSGYTNNELGSWQYKQGNYTAAREYFHRAAADAPENADYTYNMATAMMKQGDTAGAERFYRQAINIKPDHQPSYHGLAMLLKKQGRTTEAVDLLNGWVETQPYNAESYVEMAWLQRESGDISGAEQTLQRAMQVEPTHPIATAHLGQLYQDSGQHDRAASMYKRSLYSNWFQPDVKSRLATLQGTSNLSGGQQPAYANQIPAYAQHPKMLARYGSHHRIAHVHPLPTYGQPATGVIASQPATVASPAFINGDPAHVQRLGSQIPVVQPY